MKKEQINTLSLLIKDFITSHDVPGEYGVYNLPLSVGEAKAIASLIEASEQGGEKKDLRPWWQKRIESNQAIINDLENKIREAKPPSPELDAGEYLEEIGVDSATVVAYHYTNDPKDGIDIDLEKTMNDYLSHHKKQWEERERELAELLGVIKKEAAYFTNPHNDARDKAYGRGMLEVVEKIEKHTNKTKTP